jgi:hypothetical protein
LSSSKAISRARASSFVGAGATADDVADAGEQILEDVGAEDGFAHDDAAVLANGLAFQGGGG